MPKQTLQDIKSNKISKLQSISRENILPKKELKKKNSEDQKDPDIYFSDEAPYRKSKYGLWVIAGIAVFILLIILSFVFAGATININPKHQDLNLADKFSALNNAQSSTLNFSVMQFDGEESLDIKTSLTKEMNSSASGKVVFYNSYSTSPVSIKIGTSLTSSSGMVYLLDKSISVPGLKVVKGVTTPGSFSTTIHAIKPGQEYNSLPTDFSLPSFKGTSKYTKIIARSDGAISGGFVGTVNVASDKELSDAKDTLHKNLEQKLFAKATAQLPINPNNFFIYKDGTFMSDDTLSAPDYSLDSNIHLSEKATFYALVFDEKTLTKAIAQKFISSYDNSPVYIPEIRNLNFSLENKDLLNPASLHELPSIDFSLTGQARIIWSVDDQAVKKLLAGKSKNDFLSIMSTLPYVDTATAIIKPFWVNTFPSNLEKIKITKAF